MLGYRFEAGRMPDFLEALQKQGYRVIAPTIRDEAIVYDEIESAEEIPVGWTDKQDKGSYSLEKRDDRAWFAYNVGPTTWKKFLYPPEERLWRSQSIDGELDFREEPVDTRPAALLGVRSCELKALAIQDKIFTKGPYTNERYQARRNACLVVAVNCTRAGATCFCVSTNSGPKADSGYDIALTEVVGKEHFFLAESYSAEGEAVLESMKPDKASDGDRYRAGQAIQEAADNMGRTLNVEGLPHVLANAHNHPHWDEVAKRCLNCANCTMVCPTCFCSSVEDKIDLTGQHAERWRQWSSCFNLSFSYIHGGSIRKSGASRYRQWLTHKLSSWVDQFGELGCVGCGRCIAWCPVGIDLTEEAEILREEKVP